MNREEVERIMKNCMKGEKNIALINNVRILYDEYSISDDKWLVLKGVNYHYALVSFEEIRTLRTVPFDLVSWLLYDNEEDEQ